ncbi:triphosphoribosyl-dephospho-CoA synthase [Erwinia psidii]|uniref:Probable 2-(5''-triphosphoribosyl)-3'-dephosphocoenzyme-A synthase n=1 Tax=Erwinia psidii TaxID=69224 RepID=A0A3N6RZ77_9GAMM|nr:triphosphoribosyl-dephospho-CoA synthase [Erwinia psidii]MCX8957882.1 triphosphoribosyl-dephospho-CoA synthase [Erwinia psidii]MCX8960933.1 triphosphoribosyl-dephospho-CoA synthase [Erwinia psidii]RQM38494.1 triphosphoribosyl-dephospho-CoA synthase [Erwinia psidii]
MTGLPATERPAVNVPHLAEEALRMELALTPKPGLVDAHNSGAHRDMDYTLLARSIDAIAPWFSRFTQLGGEQVNCPASEQLCLLRPMALACEQAMYRATGGVNTHKGGIFALSLLCFAAGRLEQVTSRHLCQEVSDICQGLVTRELVGRDTWITAGEKQFQRFGLTGARGEAESGFATVRRVSVGWDRRDLHTLLLRIMAVNPDSNLVSRGGLSGLQYVQRYAQRLLDNGWDIQTMAEMDRALIARNLSPGGSADLLSVGWLLSCCD